LDKENATTDIGAVPPFGNDGKAATRDKKSRSKSLGPGGLDALQNSNGNRRKVSYHPTSPPHASRTPTDLATFQSTASFPLKSILKPTVPVSPVRNIPSFEETRRRTPARDARNQKAKTASNGQEGLLIDFATPSQPPVTDTGDLANPFDTFNATSAIREEMAATKERDDKERKERERQTILEKREARRKSMGSILPGPVNNNSQVTNRCLNSEPPSIICPRGYIAHLERDRYSR
jgi:kinetochore protein Spc7/SPC105